MTRILIADDHAVVRQGLKQILANALNSVLLGEAASVTEMFALLKQGEWDAVIMDLSMPGGSGLEALKQIKHDYEIPVLVLSVSPEDQYAVRTLRAGAAGYLTKETAPEELVQAVERILRGGKYVSTALAETLAGQIGKEYVGALHESLSDRELEVLCLIASGKAVGQIAEELKLSVKTVSTYRARVLQKMKLKTNAELTHYAIQNGLVK
jgi:DNA-binding NarL/FixJ family response regulator